MLLETTLLPLALLLLQPVLGQRQYGYNRRDVIKDNDIVAQFFPDSDVELLSPAFAYPETIQEGFHEGLVSPTNDSMLGKFNQLLGRRRVAIY